MLILNKKAIANNESQLFQSELEKFRPHQNRLLQATHKQTALMKELTRIYGVLLQDKRVKSEQAKYESFTRQRNSVLTKYKKVFQAFNDLIDGLMRAQNFYSEMKETVESLEKNVETFVNNRRSEGAQLLTRIEQDKASSAGSQADRERDRLREIMERMSVDPSPTKSGTQRPTPSSRPSQSNDIHSFKSPPVSPPYYSKQPSAYSNGPSIKSPVFTPAYQKSEFFPKDSYNPMEYPYQTPVSPPPSQHAHHAHPQYSQQQSQYLPQGYIPPPPPPGPPPSSQGNFGNPGYAYPSGPGGYANSLPPRKSSASAQQSQNDPWAGLNAWK